MNYQVPPEDDQLAKLHPEILSPENDGDFD